MGSSISCEEEIIVIEREGFKFLIQDQLKGRKESKEMWRTFAKRELSCLMALGIPWDPWLRYERTCSDTWYSSKCQVWGASATGPEVGSGAPAIVLITERDCNISSANFWAVGSTSVWCSAIKYWSNFWSWSRSSCKSVSTFFKIKSRGQSSSRNRNVF